MPAQQCPECGRSLESALVAGLDVAPAPCPGCGIELDTATLARAVQPTAGDAPGSSIRPPDLPPDSVRDHSDDVLAGWDVGVDPAEVAGWRRDERPFPVDTLVVVGGLVAGTVAGAAGWSAHRGRGAALGGLVGLLVAAAGRRLWRLEG